MLLPKDYDKKRRNQNTSTSQRDGANKDLRAKFRSRMQGEDAEEENGINEESQDQSSLYGGNIGAQSAYANGDNDNNESDQKQSIAENDTENQGQEQEQTETDTSEEDFEQEFCDKYKFIQTCDGEKQNATGVACNGKYNYCECEQGYVWKNNICQKDVPDGANGDLYYCNGQVVAVRVGMDFYVALRNTGSANISAQDAISAGANYTFCNNIKGHLPTKTELQTLYRYFSQVNQLLAANGGQEITKERYWSSTEDPNNPNFRIYTLYYTVNMADGSLYSDRDDVAREYRVRPVLPL